MNILHINKFHYLRGGAEAVYLNTARGLEAYGCNSVFFSMKHPQNLPCETSNYFMPYVDLIDKNGFINQIKTAGRILYSFEAKKRLSNLLDEYSVDLAHFHNVWHHISPSILHTLKKRNIPVVMTLHDYKLICASYHLQANGKPCEACHGRKYFMAIKKSCVKESFIKSLLCTLEMYLHHKILDIYDNVDVFISPSRFLKNKFLEMGFEKEIIHLPNYIEIEKFRDINNNVSYGNIAKDKTIVYFGRLSPEKGLSTLIEAAKLLSGENTEINIKIVGDGPIRDSLEEKVKIENIGNVKFLGYMKGESLYQEIKKSRAAVLPSEWYENNPMSILEAFALKKPVIGSRIGGIPELVKEGETGYAFEPGNAVDLSEKIKLLLSDNESCIEMGVNAYEFVVNDLNQEKHFQKLIGIYKQVGLQI